MMRGSTYKPRGRWSARSRGRYPPVQSLPREIPPALGTEFERLSRKDISDELTQPAEITDCQYLASYNLMNEKNLLIPGRPPLWTPSPDSARLDQDTGDYYRDENAARFPEHPFEPVVLAIYQMQAPQFNMAIDVAACGSTLGNLLRFVCGNAEPFSFTVQVIGKTAFFVRRERSPTELIGGMYGFGHTFVERNTTWSSETKSSSSHQRIITYELGRLKLLVRFEADSYMMEQTDNFGDPDGGCTTSPSASVDELVDALQPAKSASVPVIQQKGGRVAQSSIIDIKTRSTKKERTVVMVEQLPRLWLRQVTNLVLAFHHPGGVFDPAEVQDISSLLLDWEVDNKEAIIRLLGVIDAIKLAASKVQVLEVRCNDNDTLQFHQVADEDVAKWQALPNVLHKKWAQI